ncbi:MAG: universal stress protein [Pseudomonadota bacterium]
MRNLLVVVDNSPEATRALQMACRFESGVRIHPIHISPPPGHDLAIGAGWARMSWTKENMRQARKEAQDLIVSQGRTCPMIEEPVVASGDPIRSITEHFVQGDYDMLIVGDHFRGLEPLALARRFFDALRKSRKDLPLLVVRNLGAIKRTLALTDGGDASAKSLGFLNRISPLLSEKITLLGLAGKTDTQAATEPLILERGLAILKEKDIDADGFTAGKLGRPGLKTEMDKADLLVYPLSSDACSHVYETFGTTLDAILFYMTQD